MTRLSLRLALLAGASLVATVASAADAPAADTAADTVQSVVVTAPRIEVTARREQKDAPNLINIQSAETIEKYPDFNAAEALGRIPGVSISTDTGEGRFVNIRGIDGNLAGATFGAVPLLNTNPGGTYFGGGGRAVEYDTVPTGSIDGIIVTKTTLPDHEAEGLGGTVELTPRTAANITRPFFEGTLGWGYEPEHDHTGPFNIDLAGGARFGFANGRLVVEGVDATEARVGWVSNPTPFSFVLTASRRDDFRGFDDIEEDYNNPGVTRDYQDLQLRQYNYHRRRFGYGGEFDFKPNDNHSYYFRANVAGYTESVLKNRLTYDFSNYTPTPTAGGGFTSLADVTIKATDEQETHRNQVYAVGGRDVFDQTILDYRASYSRATFAVGKNYGTTFTGPTVAVAYNNSGNDGDTPALQVTDGTNINNAALYNLKKNSISNAQEADVDEEYAYAANLQFAVNVLNSDDRIKVGLEARLRDKDQTTASESFKVAPLNLANASNPANTDFYGRYTNGPDVQNGTIEALAQTGVASGSGAYSLVFNAVENIYAGYAQYTGRVGPWGLLAGVRVEKTQAKYGSPFTDPNDVTTFLSAGHDYTDVFPTLQLRYTVSDDVIIRATYSTGIGRPGFNQVTGAAQASGTVAGGDAAVTAGNPTLRPTTGDNFDLSFEWYLPRGGILQIGAFDKEFSNYIVTYYSPNYTYEGPYTPFDGSKVQFTSFGNVSSAYARGIEAAYHQQFLWLPKPWDGFGVESNLTLVDSRIQEYSALTSATGHAEYGLLPGTSRATWNLSGFYEANGLQVRLAAEYVSKELFSLGGSKASDTIQDNRLTMDFTTSYQFAPHWVGYLKVKNLTNEPLRFFVGNSSFPIQREIYDVTYEAGVRAKF